MSVLDDLLALATPVVPFREAAETAREPAVVVHALPSGTLMIRVNRTPALIMSPRGFCEALGLMPAGGRE